MVLVVLTLAVPAWAQEPDHVLHAGEAVGESGGFADLSVFLSTVGGVEAFSFALCTNPEVAVPVEVGQGEAFQIMNGGEGPAKPGKGRRS